MKVVTVGRSSQNDITVNDPKVSRHHCQIVQYDDGSYGIVDFGSTNGTYVNGQKVHGEEGINPNDVVRIGYTTLPWRNYFGTVMPPPKKTKVLPIVLGIAGGVLVMAAMIAFVFFLLIPRDVPYICSTDAQHWSILQWAEKTILLKLSQGRLLLFLTMMCLTIKQNALSVSVVER